MHWYFKKSSDEERGHAMKFLTYLNKRGGRIILTDIKNPDRREWGTAHEAMSAALDLEKSVNEVCLCRIEFFFYFHPIYLVLTILEPLSNTFDCLHT